MKNKRLSKFYSTSAVSIIAAAVIFFTLFNSLAGCSSSRPLARVFSGFDVSFTRPYENLQHYQHFKKIYNKYSSKNETHSQQLKHFSDAFERVTTKYVEATDDNKLIEAAINGIKKLKGGPGTIAPTDVTEAALDSLMATLDPHSSYLNPEEYKESRVVTSGEFGGLGIEINMDRQRKAIRIIAPIADTPAHRAGLKAGDLITHVDGDPIKGMDLRYAVKRLRGKPQSRVRLSIQRPGIGPFDVIITRAIIHIQPVKWQTDGDVGVIRITHFISSSEDALERALHKLLQKLNYRIAGLVLDLRNNPGGLLNQSVAVADAFLNQGEIVSVRSRTGNSRGFAAYKGDVVNGLPLVVLINQGSASASEIVAGALQDHGRAIVMGSRSFGKGSVQTITPLDWDGALRLTTALYYLPSGRTIQGSGVAPDIEITKVSPIAVGQLERDLPNTLKVNPSSKINRTRHQITENFCPAAGEDRKDKVLGCAVLLLRSGSESNFLALMSQRSSLQGQNN